MERLKTKTKFKCTNDYNFIKKIYDKPIVG